ncbi:MAG: bifunctional 5,10-methylenetetrahydrofolate dehydrogenase/5,10-methenyltetrahydrofolate cyclohydrolase [Fimbriimonadaceae bacterium]
MSAQLLDGKSLSKEIRQRLKARVEQLSGQGVVPKLSTFVASQDPASRTYVAMKRRWAEQIGIETEQFDVEPIVTQLQLEEEIERRNEDPAVQGILVQHPLPPHIDEDRVLERLGARKDVDGFTPESLGRLAGGLPGFRCATPLGMLTLLDHYQIPITGKRAVVVGRSRIVGKPAALMLLEANATVTIAHSKTVELPALCREADILVAAVGRPEFIKAEWVRPGAVVIDAGYNKVAWRDGDVGDVDFGPVSEVASWITPVPGGVGPMTVASLLANVVQAAEQSLL